jgi:MFS family permease
MVIGSPLGGRIAARTGPRPPIVAGLALMAGAVFWISTVTLSTGYGELVVPSAMMGFGVGIALTPMNLAAMNAISRDHAGAASGLLVTLSGLGATLGVAVTGAIFNGLLASRTQSLSADAGVTVTRAQADQLDGVLSGTAGAQQTLKQIAGDRASEVEHAVREAFVSSLGTALKLSGVLVLIGLVLAIVLLRRTSADDARPTPPVVGAPTPRPAPRVGVEVEVETEEELDAVGV